MTVSGSDSLQNSRTEWERVDGLTDQDLADPENPPLEEGFWTRATFVPGPTKQVTLRLDPDILDFFKRQGPGYQRRINAVLRRYVDAGGEPAARPLRQPPPSSCISQCQADPACAEGPRDARG